MTHCLGLCEQAGTRTASNLRLCRASDELVTLALFEPRVFAFDSLPVRFYGQQR